jgi:hypothetical protein
MKTLTTTQCASDFQFFLAARRMLGFRLLQTLPALAVLLLLWSGTLAGNGAENPSPSDQSRHNNSEQVLFPFDDYAIPFNSGLLMTLVHAKKSLDKPVLQTGKPGDPDYPKLEYYGTVIHIGDEYRMWYVGLDNDHECISLATSKNGVDWAKPKLGLVDYNGSKQNNVLSLDGTNILSGATALVLYEPEDPNPDHRFKMLRELSPTETLAAYSSDGLRWNSIPGGAVVKDCSLEACGLMKFNGCYYLNGHGGPIPHPLKGAGKRMSVTFVSYDFEHWTQAGHISFRRDAIPPRPPADFEFHRGEQVHMGASLWNRGNVVLGFYGQYHNPTNDRRTSTCDIGLIVSHDCLHFTEPVPDYKFVESYEESDGADARLLQGQGFENIGDRTIYWYSVWATTPGSPTGVRIATWPRDRFGYFSPGPNLEQVHCISSPVKFNTDKGEIYINADQLADKCQLRVELLNEQFVPLPAYSGENCIPVTKSGLRQKVTWKGVDGVEKMSEPFRVKVSWEGDKSANGRFYAIYLQ